MGRRGDAYDNAAGESVIATIENELLERQTCTSRDQSRLALFSYIENFGRHPRAFGLAAQASSCSS